jgi:hypothetical protein
MLIKNYVTYDRPALRSVDSDPYVSSRYLEHLDDLRLLHGHKPCRMVVEVELDIVESGW